MRELYGLEWKPKSVYFAHANPVDTHAFNKHFAVPLVFDSERNGLLFSRKWLKLPLFVSALQLHAQLEPLIGIRELDLDFAAQIRRVLVSALPITRKPSRSPGCSLLLQGLLTVD